MKRAKRLSQINLNALRVAESAARHANFTRAAEESCITPSAVSQQIKKLEDQLEIKIFNRHRKAVSLTPEGEAFILSVRQALDTILSAHNQLAVERENRPVLKVTLLPTFAIRWLLPRLSTFQQRHPDTQIHIAQSYEEVDFDRCDSDVAVAYGDGAFDELYGKLLFEENLIPVCSPKLIQARMPNLNIASMQITDLANFTLLHSGTCSVNWRYWLDKAGAPHILDNCSGLYFDTCTLSVEAAVAGLGFAVANRSYVTKDLAAGRLVAPFDLAMRADNGWYLVYPKEHGRWERVQQFENWLTDISATERTVTYRDWTQLGPMHTDSQVPAMPLY